MKLNPRKLQWSLSSFFVLFTMVAVLVPFARDHFHSRYEISADVLGPLCDRTNCCATPNADGIRTWIESQSYGVEKLVPPGASKISARITEHDKYTVVANVPLIGWAEHRHTIFRCKVKGLDQNGEKFSRIRFVDWHYYYMRDDASSNEMVVKQTW